jgi:hypothetical protein
MNQSVLISLPSIESHVHDCIQAANTYLPDFRKSMLSFHSCDWGQSGFDPSGTVANNHSRYHTGWQQISSIGAVAYHVDEYCGLEPSLPYCLRQAGPSTLPISSPVSIWLTGPLPLMLH